MAVFSRGWGWLLFATLIVSTIGDEITLLTLMFRTAGAGGSPFGVPLLLVAELLPGLIATPYVGRLVDRRDAGALLVHASLAQAGLLAAIAAWPAGTIVGAGLLSLSFAVSGAATFALIPVLAGALGLSLVRANALLETVRSLGMLAGPVAGGLLIGTIGVRHALMIDAASFAVLAGVVWASGLRRRLSVDEAGGDRTGLRMDYAPLLRDRRIGAVVLVLGLGVFASAIADVAFVFLVTVSLAAGPAAFGALTTMWAGGMLLGAGVAERIIGTRAATTAFATAALMGATMLAIGILPAGAFVVGAAFVVGGGANSVHNVAVRALLQAGAPAAAQGRVAAIYGAVTRTAAIGGYVAGGLFVPDAARGAYCLGGALGVIAGLAGWLLFGAGRRRRGRG